jgi:hypothetical protein
MKITHNQLKQLILEACGCPGMDHSRPLEQMMPEEEVEDMTVIPVGGEEEQMDVSFENPDIGQVMGNIDEMSPQDAFAVGFVLGQSGDFDEMMGGQEEALASEDDLEQPIEWLDVVDDEEEEVVTTGLPPGLADIMPERKLHTGAAFVDLEPMRAGRPSADQQAMQDALAEGNTEEVWARLAGIK